jgi:putative transposase
LATVLDVFSNKMKSFDVISAMNMALATRRPEASVIHHLDHVSQDTNIEFGRRYKEMNAQPPMRTVDDAYNNATAESVFATLKCELIDRRS